MIVEFTEFPLLSLEVVVSSSFSYPRLSRSALAKIFFTSSFEILKVVSSTLIVIKSSTRAKTVLEKIDATTNKEVKGDIFPMKSDFLC